MEEETLLQFLKFGRETGNVIQDIPGHPAEGRRVWRNMCTAFWLFAWLVREEFPDYDMNRVMELALFHDMGEALTGDIPAF